MEKEIKEVEGTIDNEVLWAKTDPIHYQNISLLSEYLVYLNQLLNESIERKTVKFTVGCTAAYRSSLILPDDIDMKDTDSVVEYIREHLSECNVESEFQWLGDMEPEAAVTAEDII